MMDRRLLQILNNTACLSKSQLQGYVQNTLQPEELYAVEMHLIECPICNDALEGFAIEKNLNNLLAGIQPPAKLPSPKTKEKKSSEVKNNNTSEKLSQNKTLANNTTQKSSDTNIRHKNAAHTAVRQRSNSTKWLRPLAIAAILIIGFTLLWYFEFYHPAKNNNSQIAQNITQDSAAENVAADETTQMESYSPQPMTNTDTAPVVRAPLKDSVRVMAKNADSAKKAIAKDASAKLKPVEAADNKNVAAKNAASDEVAASPPDAQAASAIPAERAKNDRVSAANADKNISAKEDKRPQTDFEKGMSLYRQQDYGTAVLYLRDAVKSSGDPKHYDAIYYSAMSFKNTGRKNKAKDLFKKLIKEDAPQKEAAQKQLDAMD